MCARSTTYTPPQHVQMLMDCLFRNVCDRTTLWGISMKTFSDKNVFIFHTYTLTCINHAHFSLTPATNAIRRTAATTTSSAVVITTSNANGKSGCNWSNDALGSARVKCKSRPNEATSDVDSSCVAANATPLNPDTCCDDVHQE